MDRCIVAVKAQEVNRHTTMLAAVWLWITEIETGVMVGSLWLGNNFILAFTRVNMLYHHPVLQFGNQSEPEVTM